MSVRCHSQSIMSHMSIALHTGGIANFSIVVLQSNVMFCVVGIIIMGVV